MADAETFLRLTLHDLRHTAASLAVSGGANVKSVQIVAILRAEAGRSPYDRHLSDLIGELSTRSDLFRQLWAAHDVREHRAGIKSLHHPVVGDLDLTYQSMDLASDRGLQMLVFSAEPGSASSDRLHLLANWAETHHASVMHATVDVKHD